MTGYVVHYRTGSSVETESSSSTTAEITGLTNGATYTISVEATSLHLSGESEEMAITLRMFKLHVYCTCMNELVLYNMVSFWYSNISARVTHDC